MNIWEKIKNIFTEDNTKVTLEKEVVKEIINVNLVGAYRYEIEKDPNREYNWYEDHNVVAKFQAKIECTIEGYEICKDVWYNITIASAGTKSFAFRTFMAMPEDKRERIMLRELKERIVSDLKYEYKHLNSADIDKVIKGMDANTINVTIKVEKDEITKK
ncbi:hypothetical protein Kirov_65 [Bacillus phage Kirov]|uniref:Uncharacterized protein n=1 Tax=Bacillus phage Kirov TaxID=2783539 RepID=A0A7S6RB29_9CAUD|nr:hypothetical protein PQE67_gp239 [Bacillus phage Kirov]QOV08264.1 hypothetical protein Kirov_65 [Bacillus phage Kirov]